MLTENLITYQLYNDLIFKWTKFMFYLFLSFLMQI